MGMVQYAKTDIRLVLLRSWSFNGGIVSLHENDVISGPPQQLVDNYNAQLGVPVPQALMQGPSSTLLSRSESITSNGDCSMSSGIVSEVDEENGFDVDFPDGKININ